MSVDSGNTVTPQDIVDPGERDLLVEWLVASGLVAGKAERKALLYDLDVSHGTVAIDEGSPDRTFSVNLVNYLVQVGNIEAIRKLVSTVSTQSTPADRAMMKLKSRLGMPALDAKDSELNSWDPNFGVIEAGLEALYDLVLTHNNVKDAVENHRAVLKDTCAYISKQHCYKLLHDKYESLRTHYQLIDQCYRNLCANPSSAADWAELHNLVCANEDTPFQRDIRVMLTAARDVIPDDYDSLRMDYLKSVRDDMTRIINIQRDGQYASSTCDASNVLQLLKGLEKQLEWFAYLLSNVPPDLNRSLVSAATTPQLKTLVATLKRIGGEWDVTTCDRTKVVEYRKSLTQLDRACAYSQNLILRHNRLQAADIELKRFETGGVWDLDEMEKSWRILSRTARPEYEDLTKSPNSLELRRLAKEIDEAFKNPTEDQGQVQEILGDFHGQIVAVFRQADKDLLELCTTLTGKPLEMLKKIVAEVTYE